MIFLILIFNFFTHSYFKRESLFIDSLYFYKKKIKETIFKEKILNFEINKKDTFFIFKNKMFKELKRGIKERDYYKYVYEKDKVFYLLYLFKNEEFEKIYNILENKEIKKDEEYIIYLLTSLKLKKEPCLLGEENFINSPYFPYIIYLNSLFLFKNKKYDKVIENLEKINNYENLKEDIEFLKALSNFNKYKKVNEIENFLEKYPESFYKDTLYFILSSYYYNDKKYKEAKKYIEKILEKKKFYKDAIEIYIEIESIVGEECDSFLKIYEKEFGKDENFKEILRKAIFNLYGRKKYKEVIEIYENWGEFVKIKAFPLYISSLLKEKQIEKALKIIKDEDNEYLKGIGYFKIGENYEYEKNYDKAIFFYKNSLKYIKDENIYLKKLLLEVKTKRIKSLETAYKIFLKKFPQSEKKYEILKEIFEEKIKEGKKEEAFNYQKEIFKIKKDKDELEKLLKIAIQIKNYELIDSLYENLEENLKEVLIFYKIFILYKIKKDPFSALEILNKIPEREEKTKYTRGIKYLSAEIYKILGKINEAENILEDIIDEEDTISFKGILLLYEIYKEKGEIKKMEELCAKTSFRWEDEKRGHILFRLAETKELKGENEEAKKIYLLSAEYLFTSYDSLSLSLYRAGSLTDLKEEKRALLERAKGVARNPFLKEKIEKDLIDLK